MKESQIAFAIMISQYQFIGNFSTILIEIIIMQTREIHVGVYGIILKWDS